MIETQSGEITAAFDISWVADAYAKAVPSRYVAKKILVEENDVDAITEEREKFRSYIVDEYERDDMFFTSQADARDSYSWSLDAWLGLDEEEYEHREAPAWGNPWDNLDNSWWRGDPGNYDENGGQQ